MKTLQIRTNALNKPATGARRTKGMNAGQAPTLRIRAAAGLPPELRRPCRGEDER